MTNTLWVATIYAHVSGWAEDDFSLVFAKAS